MRSSFAMTLFISLTVFCGWGRAESSNRQGPSLTQMEFVQPPSLSSRMESIQHSFDGYTSHWNRFAWSWHTYAGLFATSRTEPVSDLWRLEMDIGSRYLLEELWIQRGTVTGLAESSPTVMRSPSVEEMEAKLVNGDIWVLATDRDPVGQAILARLPEELQFRRNRAFHLQHEGRTLFATVCQTQEEVGRLGAQIGAAIEIVRKYSLRKGVAGINSNYFMITTSLGHHPLDLVDMLMEIGCSWMSLCGYNDFLVPDRLAESLESIDFEFPCISGQTGTGGTMYGMSRYPDIQDNTLEQCLDWKEEHNGLFFADLSSADDPNAARFDGYVVTGPGNEGKILELDAPFVTSAGTLEQAVPPCMVLFLEKDERLDDSAIVNAILEKRAVAVFSNGSLLGPKKLCDPLRILLLDGEYLEREFVEHLSVDARVVEGSLEVTVRNRTAKALDGTLTFKTPQGIRLGENVRAMQLALEPYEVRRLRLTIDCDALASGKENPIAVILDTPTGARRALARFDFPRPVEIHPLVLEAPGRFSYPLTVWNYSPQREVDAELRIVPTDGGAPVHTGRLQLTAPRWEKAVGEFDLRLEEGDYVAKVSALGVTAEGTIAVRAQQGEASVHETDENGDGIPEIVMENSQVRAMILLFGGRVIEYTVKSKDENLLFKLWPDKPPRAGKPGGVRAFYPYGGLEEFIGYPFIGGHIVYKYEVEKAEGTCVRVRVWANIHGSRIEKTLTLFADSPVLEARYALDDMTRSINVIGINPLVEIGPSTGPEDLYFFPTGPSEMTQKSPELERYYGATLFLEEGWAAGYDPEEDVSLVVGYPVNDAMLMHMWNNHPNNTPTPYYYTELQPWLGIKHETTTYFSYYLYGQEGDWKPALKGFRGLGLVSQRE